MPLTRLRSEHVGLTQVDVAGQVGELSKQVASFLASVRPPTRLSPSSSTRYATSRDLSSTNRRHQISIQRSENRVYDASIRPESLSRTSR